MVLPRFVWPVDGVAALLLFLSLPDNGLMVLPGGGGFSA